MDNLAALFKELLARVAAIFDIFDLSFFVAGGMSLLGLRYLVYLLNVSFPEPRGEVLPVMVVILLSYVLGHLCFTLGRRFRRMVLSGFQLRVYGKASDADPGGVAQELDGLGQDKYIKLLLRSHRLNQHPRYASYLKQVIQPEEANYHATLYPLLWAELRQNRELEPSMRLISAYWVRAAIYDGLVPALILWILTLVYGCAAAGAGLHDLRVVVPVLIILVVGCAFCFVEAQNCDRYQMDELAATLSWWLDHPRDTPPTGPT